MGRVTGEGGRGEKGALPARGWEGEGGGGGGGRDRVGRDNVQVIGFRVYSPQLKLNSLIGDQSTGLKQPIILRD